MTRLSLPAAAVALGVLSASSADAQQGQEGPPTYVFSGQEQVWSSVSDPARERPPEQGDQQLAQEGAASAAGVPLSISPAVVRRIQLTLNRAGYHAGHVDGILSTDTQAALRNFQQAQGLEPTGNINLRTIAALGLMDVVTSPQGGADDSLLGDRATAAGGDAVGRPDQQIEQEAARSP